MARNNRLELYAASGADGACQPIDNVTLQAEPGETLVLLGPERAGKSSLIRLIAGFGELSGGHIAFNGHDLEKIAPRQRPFALLGERDALFPHLTVYKNIAYGLKAQRLDSRTIEERVCENLERFEISSLLHLYPEQLTRTQRHQVALVRGLATHPLVVLLDQPFDGLDPMAASKLMFSLEDLQREAGFTLIMATRDSEVALALADRIGVMGDGRMIQLGTPLSLYDRPEHALVASLTGPVNLLTGTAQFNAIDVPDMGELPANANGLAAGTPAILCVRPDIIDLHLHASDDLEICSPVEVRDVVYSGGGLKVRMTSGQQRLTARIDSRRLTPHDLPAGRRIWCTWDRDAAHVMRA